MGVEGGVGDGASEVGVLAGIVWDTVLIEVLLGEPVVYHVYVVLVGVLPDDEVRGFDVTVDVSCIMELFNGLEHLEKDVDGSLAIPTLLHGLLVVG